jgi:hypothetical protein
LKSFTFVIYAALQGGFFMLHALQQLPLNYNEFHVLSATPRNMECNMKQLPDKAGIAETVAIALCPLRPSKTMAQAQAGAETAIEMLRMRASRPFPDAASIRKAVGNLRKALEPFGDSRFRFGLTAAKAVALKAVKAVTGGR